jgi:hypothetical protein
MKSSIIISFLVCPLTLFSQINISGTVLDQVTRKPIANVVVYTNDKITMTDDSGKYVIDAKPADPVFFQQLAYDLFTTFSDSLLYNSDVYLTRNVIELQNITILPFDAQKILQKAAINLHKRMEQQVIRPYLFHIETNSNTHGEREVYALVNILLNRMSNHRYRWNMNLIRMDKIKELNKDDFYFNGHPIKMELFPQKYEGKGSLDDFNCELQDQDDAHFVIKISPRKPDRKRHWYHSYTITKQDTVLIERVSQSISNVSELTFRKRGEKSIQVLNHFCKINYVNNDKTDKYYIQDLLHIYSVKVTDNNIQRIIISKGTISSLDEIPKSREAQKKIKPWDYVLFEINFPNTPGFWKQYIEP